MPATCPHHVDVSELNHRSRRSTLRLLLIAPLAAVPIGWVALEITEAGAHPDADLLAFSCELTALKAMYLQVYEHADRLQREFVDPVVATRPKALIATEEDRETLIASAPEPGSSYTDEHVTLFRAICDDGVVVPSDLLRRMAEIVLAFDDWNDAIQHACDASGLTQARDNLDCMEKAHNAIMADLSEAKPSNNRWTRMMARVALPKHTSRALRQT